MDLFLHVNPEKMYSLSGIRNSDRVIWMIYISTTPNSRSYLRIITCSFFISKIKTFTFKAILKTAQLGRLVSLPFLHSRRGIFVYVLSNASYAIVNDIDIILLLMYIFISMIIL